jgi:dihydrofolate reductase
MRQVILYIAASLDNYIARPDGRVDWLSSPDYLLPDEDYGYHEFYAAIDTTLMGNNTYRFILEQAVPFPYPDKTNYVFSRSAKNRDTEFVRFIYQDPAGLVRQLKRQTGEDIWLVGGGQINTLLLNNDLIDKMILTLFPLTLGDGIPLFHGNYKEVKFSTGESKSYQNGIVQLTLNKRDSQANGDQ